MHTLFAAPMTCSLSVAAVLAEHAVPHDIAWVRRGPARLAISSDLLEKNPKRKVPTLVLPDGDIVTECAVVLDHLDESFGPTRSAVERRHHREWLVFIGTELHKQVLAPAFDAETPADAVADAHDRLLPHALAVCADALTRRETLLGGPPSAADAYLWWALLLLRNRWSADVPDALHAAQRRYARQPAWAAALAVDLDALRRTS